MIECIHLFKYRFHNKGVIFVRKNIFVKSMLRQHMRTVLLVLLIAAAAFMFVMRLVEYIIVTDQIEKLGSYYRSVGVLEHSEDNSAFQNVFPGAEIVRSSKYVDFEDIRGGAQGIMHDVLNANIIGLTPEHNLSIGHNTDAFFYGELISTERLMVVTTQPYVQLVFRADEVVAGYPERVMPRQEFILNYYLTPDEIAAEFDARTHYRDHGEVLVTKTNIDDMIVGQRYFMRAAYFLNSYHYGAFLGFRSDLNVLAMRALNVDTSPDTAKTFEGYLNLLQVPAEPLWYMPVSADETIDPSASGFEWLNDELERIRYSQSALQLRTTADMTAMPVAQPENGLVVLTDGRWINREDSLRANPVVVINDLFAQMRGLKVGDFITISIPYEQRTVVPMTFTAGRGRLFVDEVTLSHPGERIALEIELEIAGLYQFGEDPEYQALQSFLSQPNTIVFIPDSILPSDMDIRRSDEYAKQFEWLDGQDYIPQGYYSFVLKDARDESAFLLENRAALYALGYNVVFFESEAHNFWASAEPILQSVTLSAVVFCAVLILVLALVVFLYLRQRIKDYAVMRALGCPARTVAGRLIASILLFGLPAVALGGAGGWYFALNQAEGAMNPFGDIMTTFDFSLNISVPIPWLFFLSVIVLGLLLIIALFGTALISRRPVLEMLQGAAPGKAGKTPASAIIASGTAHAVGTMGRSPMKRPQNARQSAKTSATALESQVLNKDTTAGVPNTTFQNPNLRTKSALSRDMRKARMQASARYIFRHVVRSVAKSILAAAVALFFVLALGFLQESINRAGNEIDRLYDTTAVTASMRSASRGTGLSHPLYSIGNIIGSFTLDNIKAGGFAQEMYLESGHTWGMIVPAAPDGSFPDNWGELVGYDFALAPHQNQASLDNLLAFSDMDEFIAEHSGAVMYAVGDNEEDMEIEFGGGFDASSFVYAADGPIPVILSEQTAATRGLRPGDMAYIHYFKPRLDASSGIISGPWFRAPAIITGTHNGNTRQVQLHSASLVPVAALEELLGNEIGYITLRFTVDPAHNRDMISIREQLRWIVGNVKAGRGVTMDFDLHDEELRTVVGSMERNLSLLRLLYPVAIGLSVVIGLGLSMLLILQNAKNAAIMRVLGSTRKRALTVLWTEPLIVVLIGLIAGLIALLLIGWRVSASASVFLAGLYLVGALIGSATGALLVTNRSPLELLQVKE